MRRIPKSGLVRFQGGRSDSRRHHHRPVRTPGSGRPGRGKSLCSPRKDCTGRNPPKTDIYIRDSTFASPKPLQTGRVWTPKSAGTTEPTAAPGPRQPLVSCALSSQSAAASTIATRSPEVRIRHARDLDAQVPARTPRLHQNRFETAHRLRGCRKRQTSRTRTTRQPTQSAARLHPKTPRHRTSLARMSQPRSSGRDESRKRQTSKTQQPAQSAGCHVLYQAAVGNLCRLSPVSYPPRGTRMS
jgi:hypothetical protein